MLNVIKTIIEVAIKMVCGIVCIVMTFITLATTIISWELGNWLLSLLGLIGFELCGIIFLAILGIKED